MTEGFVITDGVRPAAMTPFQAQMLAAKGLLEHAKRELEPHEWHTLRACLLIYLQADLEREGG